MPGFPDVFPAAPQRFVVDGPEGALGLAVSVPAAADARRGTAIVCHPHPLHGGTMDNKVVTMVERALRELGLRVVRFNFRGVGASAGTHDKGAGETRDLVAIGGWVRRVRPADALWLAGFSFGSYVAANAVRELAPVAQLVSIAPPAARYPYAEAVDAGVPWLIVHGDADDVAEIGPARELAAGAANAPTLIEVAGAGHFFHGRLLDLRDAIQRGVRANLPPPEAAG